MLLSSFVEPRRSAPSSSAFRHTEVAREKLQAPHASSSMDIHRSTPVPFSPHLYHARPRSPFSMRNYLARSDSSLTSESPSSPSGSSPRPAGSSALSSSRDHLVNYSGDSEHNAPIYDYSDGRKEATKLDSKSSPVSAKDASDVDPLPENTSTDSFVNNGDNSQAVNRKKPKKSPSLYRASNSVVVTPEKGVDAPSIDSINIQELHSIIQEMCGTPNEAEIYELEKQIGEIERELELPKSVTEFRALCTKLSNLKEELTLTKSNTKLMKFIEQSQTIIEEYDAVSRRQKPSIFGKRRDHTPEDTRKSVLTSEYLSKLENELIPVNIATTDDGNRICPLCASELEDCDDHEGHIICSCGYIESTVNIEFTKPKSSRKNTKDNKSCLKAIKLIQGHHNIIFDIELITRKLDDYFARSKDNIQSGVLMRKKKLLSSGIRQGTSRDAMRSALFDMGLGKLQSFINIIAREYWGWRLPDFSDVQTGICKDVNKFHNTCSSNKRLNEGRESNMNTSWLIHRLLEHRYNKVFDIEFFRTIKTSNTQDQYDRIYNACAAELKWGTYIKKRTTTKKEKKKKVDSG